VASGGLTDVVEARRLASGEAPVQLQYYLSVYMEVPDLSALAVMRHDQCAALWGVEETSKCVQILRYWEYERISGLKHHRLPIREVGEARKFLEALLSEEGLGLEDMTAIWGTRLLETEPVGATLSNEICVHSASHLFSSLISDWRRYRTSDILALAMDAGPDMHLERQRPDKIYVGCVSRSGEIEMFPIESPATLWLLSRGKFRREEGTLMALATATSCRVEFDADDLVADVGFWTLAGALESADVVLTAASNVVERALDTEVGRARSTYDDRFSAEDNFQSAVMKIVDEASSAVVYRNVERALAEADVDATTTWLALSGGFALNGPSNTGVMNRFGFRGLIAPPCVDDSGQALGLGLLGLHERGLTSSHDFSLSHAYYGRTRLNASDALERFESVIVSVGETDIEQAVDDLIEGPVAWVNGAAEIGPRALGHRSLLGDPRSTASKEVLNEAKQRQWWRPVAPTVKESRVGEWFEENRTSPFMLEVFTVRPEQLERIPAVVHLNGTARVQTVADDMSPLAQLLDAFETRTGIPILANTSLNDRGEPLVDSASQALNFCVRRGIRVGYIDGLRIELSPDALSQLPLEKPEARSHSYFSQTAARWADYWEEWHELGVTVEDMHVWAWNPDLVNSLDPRSPSDSRVLRRLTPVYMAAMSPLERSYIHHISSAFGPESDLMTAAGLPSLIGGFYDFSAPAAGAAVEREKGSGRA